MLPLLSLGSLGGLLAHVGLFFQMAATLPARPAETHRQEVALLHQAMSPDSLRNLDVWDEQAAEWRRPKAEEVADPQAPVLLLHFWASWCKPCLEEFPVWRELAPRLEALYQGKVRIVYVALQTNNTDMERFLTENKDRLPHATWYLDVGEHLTAPLRKGLPEERFPMPVTLWLDRQRVVRQAAAGTIVQRRAEVVDSTARMVRLSDQLDRLAKQATPATPAKAQAVPRK